MPPFISIVLFLFATPQGVLHCLPQEDVLPIRDVRGLCYDQAGFLWLASQRGLYRFDGSQYHRFYHDPNNLASLAHSQVNDLTFAKQFIWLATAAGLDRLDPVTGMVTRVLEIQGGIGKLHLGPRNLWLTGTDALLALNVDTLETRTLDDAAQIHLLGAGKSGLWLMKEANLWLYSYESVWQEINADVPAENIRTLLEHSSGLLWLAMPTGLVAWDPKTNREAELAYRDSIQQALGNVSIDSLYEDSQGRIWMGSSQGIWLLNLNFGGLKQIVEPGAEPCLSGMPQFLERDSRSLWLGSASGLALYKQETEVYRRYSLKDGLPDESVNAVLEGHDQTIWIATNQGVAHIDLLTNSVTLLKLTSAYEMPREPTVQSLTRDKEGRLWLASEDHIYCLELNDSNSGPTFKISTRLAISQATDICNFAGEIWGTNHEGLDRFSLIENQIQREHYPLPNAAGERHVISAPIVFQEHLWIGSEKGLASMQQSGRLEWHSETGHLTIKGLATSQTGIWLNTTIGLAHYEPLEQSLSWLSQECAISGSNISSFGVDPNDLLLLVDETGLAVCNPKTQLVWRATLAEDVVSLPVISSRQKTSPRIYLNSQQGLTLLTPGEIDLPAKLPPLIRHLKIATPDQTLDYLTVPSEALRLPKNTSALSLDLVSGDLADTPQHLYYRLMGAETSTIWQRVPDKNLLLVALEAGSYNLQLSSGNPQSLANPPPLNAFSFELPTDMQTNNMYWWPFAVLFLMTSTLLVLARNLQLKQKQLRATQENESVMDTILANTSHELRTPIHGILGLTQALQDGVAGPLNGRAHFNLKLVAQSGRRLATLVDSLLDFAKARQNQMTTLYYEPVPLRALVNKVFEAMAQSRNGSKKSLQLRNLVPHALPAVYADPGRLQQLLQHLVSNSMKFTQQGFVAVEAKEVGDQIEIMVQDTGEGIPDFLKARIFDAFQQRDSGTTRLHSGLGLGLSISQALAEAHGSKLEMTSVQGEGSSFYFRLAKASSAMASPASKAVTTYEQAHAQTHEQALAQAQKPQAAQILIVDDNPINLQVIYNYLEDQYSLAKTFSGPAALNYIKAHELPELILLDVMMPGMSGYEVCQQLRKSYSAEALPIIFLTARGQIEDKIRGFNAGANDHLTKPVLKEELIARIELQLQLRQTHQLLLKEKQWLEKAVEMEQLKRLNRESELRLLHAQMQPHFLQNTLNSAAFFCVEDPDKAIELLGKLSTLLRQSVTAAPRGWWSVADEMKTIQAFIDVQHFRFSDRLSVETKIDPAALKKEVPCFLMQPLVENAIIHGLRQVGSTQVALKVTLHDQALNVEVCNTGTPLREPLESLLSEDHALGNINKRLLLVGSERLVYQYEAGRHYFSFAIALPEHISQA